MSGSRSSELVAVVTGGNSGIGREMATALAQTGAAVVLVGRSVQTLRSSASALPRGAFVRADLASRSEVERAIDEIRAPFGDPDILVNAAGINLRPPMEDVTVEEWDHTLAVNLTAPFLLGQAFGPRMAARGWGRIINVGSQQTIRAFGNSGAYGVSKAAVAALTRSQAEAWSRRGVCCNTIVPGFVHTPMTSAVFADPEAAGSLAARTMVGRNGVPSDFRGIIVLLASPYSDYITGQTIFVDGGFSST